MNPKPVQQFVLMPVRGLTVRGPTATPDLLRFFTSLGLGACTIGLAGSPRPKARLQVLDSIHENGAKLVELSAESAVALRAAEPGLRLVKVVYYRPALAPRVTVSAAPKAKAASASVKTLLTLVSRKDGSPVPNAHVVAFTDFANQLGAEGDTNRQGRVTLALGGTRKIERLYVYPAKGYWSMLKKNIAVTGTLQIGLLPVDLSHIDAVRHFYGRATDPDGAAVKVGVIDTGVGPHPDLVVEGGENTVVGESPGEFSDNGHGHGTHVSGIIAARGRPPTGLRGIAPGVSLRSYRVFGRGSDEASNYSIAKAIDRAVADHCDLVNMSLGGGVRDDTTRAAIEDARAAGVVVLAAAGNDGRQPVSFPGAEPMALAVSAAGRKGTFPPDSTAIGDVKRPYGTDKKNFVAAFSNIGPEIDLTGPGVDILSTVPDGYAPMSGTSMACPAATGMAARLLSRRADLLRLARDQTRSNAIFQMCLLSARALGFGSRFEGQGQL